MTNGNATYLIPTRESHVTGISLQAHCPLCNRWQTAQDANARVNPGTLSTHATEKGGLCRGSNTAITHQAAHDRDNHLNCEEQAAYNLTFRHLTGCKGPLIDTECHHPACHQAVRKGLRWTLMGWRRVPTDVLF